MKMLIQFDAELLIGQLSYKQRAEISTWSMGVTQQRKQEREIKTKMVKGQVLQWLLGMLLSFTKVWLSDPNQAHFVVVILLTVQSTCCILCKKN